MSLILNLIGFIVFLVGAFCKVLTWLLVVRILLSWVGVNPYTHFNELLGAVYQITDAVLRPFQRLPLRVGMLDLSPMVAMTVLYFLPSLVASLLYGVLGVIR